MKKVLIALILILLAMPAFAENAPKFTDMPDKHWAAQAVYDLVKLGVTQGFPDGTYRGKRQVSRYELANMISKLSRALGGGELKDLREDIKALKKEIMAMRRGKGAGGIAGSYEMLGKAGNLMAKQSSGNASIGPVAAYRLQTSLERNLSDRADVKVNLDTMDSGYYGKNRDLTLEMLDIETRAKTNIGLPIEIAAVIGPGPVQHTDTTGVLSSESGEYYIRPRTGVTVATKLHGADVSGGYIVRSRSSAQDVETSQLTGKIGINVPALSGLKLDVSADYLAKNPLSSQKISDIKGAIALSKELAPKIKSTATWGIGGREKSSWLASASIAVEDAFNTGTSVTFKALRIGSSYMEDNLSEEDLAGYDVFNRVFDNSETYIGAEVSQALTSNVKLIGRGDTRTNSKQYTVEGGIAYDIAPFTQLDVNYRLHKDALTADITDITSMGLQYRF